MPKKTKAKNKEVTIEQIPLHELNKAAQRKPEPVDETAGTNSIDPAALTKRDETITTLKKTIEDLEDTVEDLEDTVEDLETDIKSRDEAKAAHVESHKKKTPAKKGKKK